MYKEGDIFAQTKIFPQLQIGPSYTIFLLLHHKGSIGHLAPILRNSIPKTFQSLREKKSIYALPTLWQKDDGRDAKNHSQLVPHIQGDSGFVCIKQQSSMPHGTPPLMQRRNFKKNLKHGCLLFKEKSLKNLTRFPQPLQYIQGLFFLRSWQTRSKTMANLLVFMVPQNLLLPPISWEDCACLYSPNNPILSHFPALMRLC